MTTTVRYPVIRNARSSRDTHEIIRSLISAVDKDPNNMTLRHALADEFEDLDPEDWHTGVWYGSGDGDNLHRRIAELRNPDARVGSHQIIRDKIGIGGEGPIPHHNEGYPVYYCTSDNSALCHNCVNSNASQVADEIKNPDRYDQFRVESQRPNWEDNNLYCDHCGNQIEAAYEGDDQEQDEELPGVDDQNFDDRYNYARSDYTPPPQEEIIAKMFNHLIRNPTDQMVRNALAEELDEKGQSEDAALIRQSIEDKAKAIRDDRNKRVPGQARLVSQSPFTPSDIQHFQTALWSSMTANREMTFRHRHGNRRRFGLNFPTHHDIHPDVMASMLDDWHRFRAQHRHLIEAGRSAEGDPSPEENAAYDFWLSRNDHGAGFFDTPGQYGGNHDRLQEAARRYGEFHLEEPDNMEPEGVEEWDGGNTITGTSYVNTDNEPNRMSRIKYAANERPPSGSYLVTLLHEAAARDPYDLAIRNALADEIEDLGDKGLANHLKTIHERRPVIWNGMGAYEPIFAKDEADLIRNNVPNPDHSEPVSYHEWHETAQDARNFAEWETHLSKGYSLIPGENNGWLLMRHPNEFHDHEDETESNRPEGPQHMSRIKYAKAGQYIPLTPEQEESKLLEAIHNDSENPAIHSAYVEFLTEHGRHGEAAFMQTPSLDDHPEGVKGDFDIFDWNPSFNGTESHKGTPGKTRYLVYGFHPYHPSRTTQVSITRVSPDSSKKVRMAKWFNAGDAIDLIRKLEETGVVRASVGQTPGNGSYEDIYQRLQRWADHQSRYPDSSPQTVSEQDHYPIRNAAYRAPKGGAVVRGTYYQGGKLIPDLEGDFANPPAPKPVVQYPQPKRPSMRERLRAKFKREEPLVVSYAKKLKHAIGPDFQQWFSGSKIVGEDGSPLKVFHGSSRGDRLGNSLIAKRSTSGPMPYFTDDPEIASSYSTGKQDTSLAYDDDDAGDYQNWFRVKIGKKRIPLNKAWWHLDPTERQKIASMAPRVGMDDDNNVTLHGPEHNSGTGGYDQHLREARGNHLHALVEEWLNSGNLFNSETDFHDVLRFAGLNRPVFMHDPHATYPVTLPAHLSIKNPLVTHQIPGEVLNQLEKAARFQRQQSQAGTDAWDKRTRDPQHWVQQLRDDTSKGVNSFVWSSIPDWVTRTLKKMGYDGIVDTGGKMGGKGHNVYVPFHPDQVRVAMGTIGE